MPQRFDTLIRVDHAHDMTLRPGLAERWERINAQSLRLFLRKEVVFHERLPGAGLMGALDDCPCRKRSL